MIDVSGYVGLVCIVLCIYFVEPHTVTWFQHKYFLLPVWVSPTYSLAFCFQLEMKWEKSFRCIRIARVISSFHFYYWRKLLQKRKRCNNTVLMCCWIVDVQPMQRTLSNVKTEKKIQWNIRKITTILQQIFRSFFFFVRLSVRVQKFSPIAINEIAIELKMIAICVEFFFLFQIHTLEQQKVNLVEVEHKDNKLFLWNFHRIDGLISHSTYLF